jgi:hypothetical protein
MQSGNFRVVAEQCSPACPSAEVELQGSALSDFIATRAASVQVDVVA